MGPHPPFARPPHPPRAPPRPHAPPLHALCAPPTHPPTHTARTLWGAHAGRGRASETVHRPYAALPIAPRSPRTPSFAPHARASPLPSWWDKLTTFLVDVQSLNLTLRAWYSIPNGPNGSPEFAGVMAFLEVARRAIYPQRPKGSSIHLRVLGAIPFATDEGTGLELKPLEPGALPELPVLHVVPSERRTRRGNSLPPAVAEPVVDAPDAGLELAPLCEQFEASVVLTNVVK